MKIFLQLLMLATVNLSSVPAQQTSASHQAQAAGEKQAFANTAQSKPFKLPEEIRLILKVEEMPGLESPRSFWEGTYEIRVVDWKTIDERTKAGSDTGDAGVVVLQSSFAQRGLTQDNGRQLTISLPVTGALREQLQQQPQNPQAFSLRSKLRFYDGQLDRNSLFSINRIWRLASFPDGEATITIKIKPDGGFSVWGPLPKDGPATFTVIGNPPTKKP
jgi:hypothetical protein